MSAALPGAATRAGRRAGQASACWFSGSRSPGSGTQRRLPVKARVDFIAVLSRLSSGHQQAFLLAAASARCVRLFLKNRTHFRINKNSGLHVREIRPRKLSPLYGMAYSTVATVGLEPTTFLPISYGCEALRHVESMDALSIELRCQTFELGHDMEIRALTSFPFFIFGSSLLSHFDFFYCERFGFFYQPVEVIKVRLAALLGNSPLLALN